MIGLCENREQVLTTKLLKHRLLSTPASMLRLVLSINEVRPPIRVFEKKSIIFLGSNVFLYGCNFLSHK